MYLVCTFHHSFEVELLLTKLEELGVTRDRMLVMPLKQEKHRIYQITATSTGGNNLLDIPLAVGTASMLLGVIYGYVLYLGPVIWGLIGLTGGTLITLGIEYLIDKQSQRHGNKSRGGSEVMIMLRCQPQEEYMLENVLRAFSPLGFATVDVPGAEASSMIRPHEINTVE